jgi:hypothetical protein
MEVIDATNKEEASKIETTLGLLPYEIAVVLDGCLLVMQQGLEDEQLQETCRGLISHVMEKVRDQNPILFQSLNGHFQDLIGEQFPDKASDPEAG